MDLDLTPAQRAFRDEVRDWLRRNAPADPLPPMDGAEGFCAHRDWERTLGRAHLSAVTWPARYGGRDAGPVEGLLFDEEYHATGAPERVSQNGIGLLGPTLLAHGTPEQCARLLPPTASGEVVWAQAWSEPGAGSDLAAIRSRAERAEDPQHGPGWLLHGQKTWSSRAAFADRGFGLFRTSPERHRGLTYLVFDLDAPGLTRRPIGRLDGRPAFAELFFDGVFVPDADVIGAPGDGWRIAMGTAAGERGTGLRGPGRFLASAHRLAALLRESGPGGTDAGGGAPGGAAADRVARAWIGAQAYRLHAYAAACAGAPPGAGEAAMNKLFWSELDADLHETALDLLGPEAELDGPWMRGHVFSLAGPVYAGTNEIQRDIVAERVLGLPRPRRSDR
ncbi:acyl-CoA dehydrogenase family protein [Nocardiopsis suaedae]|uniref:Acyl-CoA dehydrogenase family protein n=1 Tax=Nocardiopsis suaedae TaxID=3018444 RepID=A0ABT4TQD3_9ACTN|nr:acyl-CoA dehydrogenase family protein [Nocardiopsis suaedae]MDA2806898.1 acyl-CoA dehydrogenase family protein [Nocardiopsis suaedae]